jgi:hypothetical protein
MAITKGWLWRWMAAYCRLPLEVIAGATTGLGASITEPSGLSSAPDHLDIALLLWSALNGEGPGSGLVGPAADILIPMHSIANGLCF